MTSSEWLPAQAPFELVRRGYNPEQVTAHLERLEYELRISTANREGTNQRISELTSQLQAAQAETDTLRAQLDRNALAPVSMTGLSDRMQRMIRLAEEEAAEIRARAESDAAEMRTDLQTALNEASVNRQDFDAERERTRTQLAEQVQLLIGEATDEAAGTRAAAQAEAARLVGEATAEATRLRAEADAESTRLLTEATAESTRLLTEATAESTRLLTEATAESTRLLTEATAESNQTVSDAREAAEKTTADAVAAAERLDTESTARRTGVEEDFEIAIQARRTEAHRTITEREQQSVAEAARLVAEATADADNRVATATADAEQRVAAAQEHARVTVEQAAAEAHHRVAEADAAVRELSTLRARINEQLSSLLGHLDHIRGLAGSTPEVLAPLAEEPSRPRTEDFPADPTGRAVSLPGAEQSAAPSDQAVVEQTAPETVVEAAPAPTDADDDVAPVAVNGNGQPHGRPVRAQRRR